MTAYRAIIKDSFREAMSSRVLPLLLAIFTIALAVLSPIGLKEQSTAELTFEDIVDARGVIARMQQAEKLEAPSPGKYLWNRMPAAIQKQLIPVEGDRGGPLRSRAVLRVELNRQIHEAEFYDAEAWKDVELPKEGRELAAQPAASLTEDQLARRNRIALESAFPALIAQSPKTSVKVSWAGRDIPFLGDVMSQFGVERDQVRKNVQGLLSWFCRWFLGVFGIFIAILVSAGIIPRMFEPGSIDLLLSKPVSRSMLFLTKFFSGCAFIFLNVAYFMLGIWMIVGIRLGVWSGKLLLTIPLFLFIFMIVYSISAIASVYWRNPIISVMISVLVWGFCLGLGFIKSAMDGVWNAASFAQIVPAGDTLIAATKSGNAYRWDAVSREWKETLRGGASPESGALLAVTPPFVGLHYDPQRDQVVGVQGALSPLGVQTTGTSGSIIIGRREDGFERSQGISPPSGTYLLFLDSKSRLVATGTAGVYRCDGDPGTMHRPFKIFGLDIAGRPEGPSFLRKGPNDATGWFTPFAAAMDPTDDSLAIYDRGRLRRYALDKTESYVKQAERTFESQGPVVLGAGGATVLMANADGDVLVLDRDTLETRKTFNPFGKADPRAISVSPDGRWFALVYHQKKLCLYDAKPDVVMTRGFTGQGDITAATLTRDGRLLIAHRTDCVASYTLDPLKAGEQWNPPSTNWDIAYRYVTKPLYAILPKPGHIDYLINYLFTEEESESVDKNNLQAERHVVNMWEPIWGNLIFLTVVLGMTCWYVSRKDF